MRTLPLVAALALSFALYASIGQAARVEIRGVGIYQYEGSTFSRSKPSDEDKARAVAAAKSAAWKNFIATLSPSAQRAIAEDASGAFNDPEKFIIDLVIVDTFKDNDNKTLNVIVRVAFNDEAVSQVVQKVTVGGVRLADDPKGSLFTFLFMSRKATSVRQFDVRRTDVVKSESAVLVKDDKGVSTIDVAERGGSSLAKEDAVTYAVGSSQDLDSAMGEVLAASGVEYVAYDDVVGTCNGIPTARFQDEYVNADELSPQTRMAVIKAAQSCDIRYLATGTIDSEVASVDPVTGNQRVFVSVRAQLWDIDKDQRLPRKVGSVGPKQYSGLGPNQSVASRNALSIAAKATAKDLVDQLNAKHIR